MKQLSTRVLLNICLESLENFLESVYEGERFLITFKVSAPGFFQKS